MIRTVNFSFLAFGWVLISTGCTTPPPFCQSDGDCPGCGSCVDGSCDESCLRQCGNGVVETGEECDNGAQNADNDNCTSSCKTASCGDNLVYTNQETCDDGNTDDCLGDCLADCSGPSVVTGCGDGLLCGDEVCDDGNNDDCAGDCSANCTHAVTARTLCDDGAERSYDICVGNDCISPGCGDASCNAPEPDPPWTSGLGPYTRTGPVEGEYVVQDEQTSLVWQGCEAGLSGSECEGVAEEMIWSQAVSYCDELDWGAYRDWYLPDRYEIDSIVNRENSPPTIDIVAFPGTSDTSFWSSSSQDDDWARLRAFCASFYGGYVITAAKDYTYNVRCVRRWEP